LLNIGSISSIFKKDWCYFEVYLSGIWFLFKEEDDEHMKMVLEVWIWRLISGFYYFLLKNENKKWLICAYYKKINELNEEKKDKNLSVTNK
jgi:hypothetical protein